MSQPRGGRGGGRGGGAGGAGVGRKTPSSLTGPPDDSATGIERATPASKADSDPKDDSSSNGDKKDGDLFPAPKPPSAGASIRDTANKVLALAMKSEWTPIEAELKKLEKYVANVGEDGNHIPLAGVHDMVSIVYSLQYTRSGTHDFVKSILSRTGKCVRRRRPYQRLLAAFCLFPLCAPCCCCC